MNERVLIVIAFAVVAAKESVGDEKHVDPKAVKGGQSYHLDVWLGLPTVRLQLPSIKAVMPLLKEAAKKYNMKPFYILAAERFKNVAAMNEALKSVPPRNHPQLKNYYTVLFITSEKPENYYQFSFGETTKGKAYAWAKPETEKFFKSELPGYEEDQKGKTIGFLKNKDFKGLHEFWNPKYIYE